MRNKIPRWWSRRKKVLLAAALLVCAPPVLFARPHKRIQPHRSAPTAPSIPKVELQKLESECAQGIFEGCYFLGLLKVKSREPELALKLFQKACAGGYSEACDKQRTLDKTVAGVTDVGYSQIKFLVLDNGFRIALLPSTQT